METPPLAYGAMLAAGVCLTLPASTAFAEGSAELGSSQRLRSTTLQLDIVDPTTESVTWSGAGTLTVTAPDGTVVGTISSGGSLAVSGYQPGVYTLTLSQTQTGSWDIGVTDGTTTYPGRLFTSRWNFDAGSFSASAATNASFYAIVPGGAPDQTAVVELKLDGLAGYVYDITANSTGVDGDQSGISVPSSGNSVTPEYPLYLNPPELSDYATLTPTVSNVSFSGTTAGSQAQCNSIDPGVTEGTFRFDTNVEGGVQMICDVNGDGTFDPSSNVDVTVAGTAQPGTNTLTWDGTDNESNPVPYGTYDCIIRIGVGEFHYVGNDIETSYEGMRMYVLDRSLNRSPLTMFWNDELLQAKAVALPNGDYGAFSAGPNGVNSGPYTDPATPHGETTPGNARAWGDFSGAGRGDVSLLDTYAFVESVSSTSITVETGDNTVDSDGDGLSDIVEECTTGSDPNNPDTDGDGISDFVEADGGSWIDTDGDGTIDARDTDTDDDGILDSDEGSNDSDNDSVGNWRDADSDNDGIDDSVEGRVDSDGDLTYDYLDTDSDDDGIDDSVEGNVDSDGDSTPDYLDLDSDDDTLPDSLEGTVDSDNDGAADYVDADSDNDGIDDAVEGVGDTDLDTIPDYLDTDSDADGILDADEGSVDSDGDGTGNWRDFDSDADGIGDAEEGDVDFDGDSIPDYLDLDSDDDGIDDAVDMLRWGVGVEGPAGVKGLSVRANAFGNVSLADARDPFDSAQRADNDYANSAELLAGVSYALPRDLAVSMGAGTGLSTGVGSPAYRLFTSLGWKPVDHDADDDGVLDADDQCSELAEDIDGYEDLDGCPDLDNDADGLEDVDDQCPMKAEDFNDIDDKDGCPDADADHDEDGIANADDQCPTEAEDVDEFEDADGCPDLDNDADKLVDADDQCPNQAEVFNGFEDEDGCPDKGESKVKVTEAKIDIMEKIYFDTNRATIRQRSHDILDEIVTVLGDHPEIAKVRIEGHTDSKGSDAHNLELSQKRAEAVLAYLVDKGIDATRLEAKGYGETKPIADNATEEGREENRRVTFTILSGEETAPN